MKDLITKLKTMNYKKFGLEHGEKIGIVIVALIVLVSLGLTNWASEYTGEPRDMEKKAEDVAEQLKRNVFTEERQKEFPYLMAEGELQKIETALDFANYENTIPFSQKLYPKQEPADEVIWLPVADLRVKFGKFPLGIEDTSALAELASEEGDAPRPKDEKKKPERSGSRRKDREKSSEDDIFGRSSSFGMRSDMGGGYGAA